MDAPVLWWTEGNGSCDCNRAICFGEELAENTCAGCSRFVAIDIHGDTEGYTKKEILEEMNSEYPDELKKFWSAAR